LVVRWLILLAVLGTVTLLGAQRYDRDVRTVAPGDVVSGGVAGTARVLGMVEAGTLKAAPDGRNASFVLVADGSAIPVIYSGESPDNLRELKTLVAVGQWDPIARVFQARVLDLVPNYGFIVSAYALTLIPLAAFVFVMERRVKLLYTEIKRSKVYTPEVDEFD
jgi:cytochrome c-type biogenesis protein CcmE